MKVYRLEKRADVVIHWLERMKKSYNSGALESAYMDAECARADLEELKTDVFAGLNPRSSGRLHTFMRTVILSVIILMVMVKPLSRDPERLPAKIPPVDAPVAQPTAITREASVHTETVAAQDTKARKPRKIQAEKRRKTSAPSPVVSAPKKSPPKTVAYDKVLSLLQTGQRAMKNDQSVIKVK